jgi:hypothetical protein
VNHTEATFSFSRSGALFSGLTLPFLVAGLLGGCIAPAADTERQTDPSRVEGSTGETPESAGAEKSPIEEREHVVDVKREPTRAVNPGQADDTVAPPRAVDETAGADDSSSQDPQALVAAASSPTDTPQPSPWKGHNPPPIGPGAGPPSSDTASSP